MKGILKEVATLGQTLKKDRFVMADSLQKRKKIVFWGTIAIALFSVTATTALYFAGRSRLDKLPKQSIRCLPAKGLDLALSNPVPLGFTEKAGDRFYLIVLTQSNPRGQDQRVQYVVSVDRSGQCTTPIAGSDVPLASKLDPDVANELTRFKVRAAIAALGKDEFVRQLGPALNSDRDGLLPELKYALEKEGVI